MSTEKTDNEKDRANVTEGEPESYRSDIPNGAKSDGKSTREIDLVMTASCSELEQKKAGKEAVEVQSLERESDGGPAETEMMQAEVSPERGGEGLPRGSLAWFHALKYL